MKERRGLERNPKTLQIGPFEKIAARVIESVTERIFDLKKKEIEEGLFIGFSDHEYHPTKKEKVILPAEERLKHIYAIGATGSGKTKLIESMIRQDILRDHGFCLIDPHGDLTQSILEFLANESALLESIGRKLILVEPQNTEVSIGFNPLSAKKEKQYLLILELMGIFRKLWKDASFSPRMEELLRNTLLTLAGNNLTLLEAKMLLANQSFREKLTEKMDIAEARDYWCCRYNTLSDKMQALYREPILNRLSVFTGDPLIRLIIGQAKSTFDFREAMDQGKWLLINLSKGSLRENSSLLGSLFIAKLQLAAMSRVGIPESERRPFYLYVDEFQNFVSEDFKTILSEARKYGLGLTLAHQNLAQLDAELRSAILGNAATRIFFRLSHHDASYLASELSQRERIPIERKLTDLRVGEAYLKRKGERARLIKARNLSSPQVRAEKVQALKRASFLNYARPRKEIEEEIEKRARMYSGESSNLKKTDDLKNAVSSGYEEGLNGW